MAKKTTKFITSIHKEFEEISKIREKYGLNNYNFDLFNKKSAKMLKFEDEVVRFWRENLTEL